MGPSLFSLVEEAAALHGDEEFIFDGARRLSFRELEQESLTAAQRLWDTGLRSGDTVLSFLPNWAEYAIAYTATSACDGIYATAPVGSKSQRMQEILELVEPKVVLVMSSAQADGVLASGFSGLLYIARAEDDRCQPFSELLAPLPIEDAGTLPSEFQPCREQEVSTILFTSGSTGKPKGVLCTADALLFSARIVGESLHLQEDDVYFSPLSWCHIFGLSNGFYGPLLGGKKVVTGERYRPERALEIVQQEQATIQIGVPTMFIRQLKLAQSEGKPLRLRTGIVGGAGRPPEMIRDFDAYCGSRLLPSYGMTEATGGITYTDLDAPQEVRHHSEGVLLPGIELRVCALGDETLSPLPVGAQGQFFLRSPGNMGGYYTGGPKVCDPALKDAFIPTGDIGYLDQDGCVHVVDRVDNVIIRGGINLYPSEVERVYTALPQVLEAVLVGYPDEELGERSCLFLSMVEGEDEGFTPDDLRTLAFDHLEKHKVPDRVVILDTLPKLEGSNKIDRKGLAALAAQRS